MENIYKTIPFFVFHGYYFKDTDIFSNINSITNLLSIIPGINVITGLFKLIIGIVFVAEYRLVRDQAFALGLALRGLTEILFGPLLLLSDIAITCLRLINEPKSHSDCSELIAVKA